jgi:hypothetical protein
MTKITPRFFVLPLIALAVIVSLPRSSAQGCVAQATPAAGIVRPDTNSATGCTATGKQFVMAPIQSLTR